MLALARVAEIIANPRRPRAIPAVDTKRNPLTAGHGMYVHVGATGSAKEQPLFVAGSEASLQEIATGRDPPAAFSAPHDQRAHALLAHADARALRRLVGTDCHRRRHVTADGTPREGIREIAPDADDADGKTPLRDDQVLDPKGGRDSEGLGDGAVRGDSHRLVTHDVSNTHTTPSTTGIETETESGKQAKRRWFDDIISITAVFLAPEADVKL
jgi:hypothetical protein